MKNLIIKFSILVFVLAGVVSCEEDVLIYDVENGQTLAQFSNASASLPTPEAGGTTTVDVLVSTVSSSERTIEVSVDESSTASADSYQISNLVIPANSYVGTITITSNFEAIPETGSTSLVLNLEGVGNGESLVENGTYTLELFRKCPIVLSELVGTWAGDGVWAGFFGGYSTQVVTKLDDNGDLLITGILFEWFEDPNFWGEVIVNSEFVKVTIDEETGEITIPEQYYVTTTFDGDEYDYTIRGTITVVNACNKIIEIRPVIKTGNSVYTGAEFGSPVFVERIQLP